MSLELQTLVSQSRPSLTIYDKTYEIEKTLRARIQSFLLEVARSNASSIRIDSSAAAVVLESMISLNAEKIARVSADSNSPIHLQREHFEKAGEYLTMQLKDNPMATSKLVTEWQSLAEHYLRNEMKALPKREAILRTCDYFRVDVADFKKVIPELPR